MVVEEDEGEDDYISGLGGVGKNDTDKSTVRTHDDLSTLSDRETDLKSANLSSKNDREILRIVEPDSKKPVFITEEDEMREREMETERIKNGGNQVHCSTYRIECGYLTCV
jgi:hypothetical protein